MYAAYKAAIRGTLERSTDNDSFQHGKTDSKIKEYSESQRECFDTKELTYRRNEGKSFLELVADVKDSIKTLTLRLPDDISEVRLLAEEVSLFFPGLTELLIYGYPTDTDVFDGLVKKLADRYPKLLKLTIGSLPDLPSIFPKLTDFTMHAEEDNAKEYDLESFWTKFVELHQHLKHLSIEYESEESEVDIGPIITKLPLLESLKISKLNWADEERFEFTGVASSDVKLSNLTKLDFSMVNFGDDVFQTILKNSPNLLYLRAFCPHLTDRGLEPVVTHCPKLETLIISDAECDPSNADVIVRLTDNIIGKILRSCQQLKHVLINDVKCLSTESLVSEIASSCPNITHLEIASVEQLRDDTVLKLVDNCSGLTKLDISHRYGRSSVTSLSVRHAIDKCRSLEEINLRGLGVDDAFLDIEMRNGLFLKYLNLKMCFNITDKTVGVLVKHCPNLTVLNLSGDTDMNSINPITNKLTDASLKDIAAHGKKLEKLVMVQNWNITAVGVFEVVRCCPEISSVEVSIQRPEDDWDEVGISPKVTRNEIKQLTKASKDKIIRLCLAFTAKIKVFKSHVAPSSKFDKKKKKTEYVWSQ